MTAEKGLYLDGTSVSLPDGATTFAVNFELDSNYISYVNADGFKLERSLEELNIKDILGKIELPNGVILFGFTRDTNISSIYHLEYNAVINKLDVIKRITSVYLNFNTHKTVTGIYTYNYKNEVCIVFSDGVDGNEIRYINITTLPSNPTAIDIKKSILNPEYTYPSITTKILTANGSLEKGAYQFSIRYKADNYYTSFCPLTYTSIIGNDANDTSAMTGTSNKSLSITLNTLDSNYTEYDLAIVYTGRDKREARIIKNINTSQTVHIITTLEIYPSIPIEEVLIRPVSIFKGESFAINKGAALIGNVKYQDKVYIDRIVNNILSTVQIEISLHIYGDNTQVKSFQEGEYYVMYMGIIDEKGSLINTYPIRNLVTTTPEYIKLIAGENIGTTTIQLHNEKGTSVINYNPHINLYNFQAAIDEVDVQNKIKSVVILFAEHNEYNSVILSEALFIRDTYRYMNGNYTNQHMDGTGIRLYPFEYLYNPRSNMNCKIKIKNWADPTFTFSHPEGYGEVAKDPFGRYISGFQGYKTVSFATKSFDFVNDLKKDKSRISDSCRIDYIYPLNESLTNLQGDAYYRLTGNAFFNRSAFKDCDGSESPDAYYIIPNFLTNHFNEEHKYPKSSYPTSTDFDLSDFNLNQYKNLYNLKWRCGICYLVNSNYSYNCSPTLLYGNLRDQSLAPATNIIPLFTFKYNSTTNTIDKIKTNVNKIQLEGDCFKSTFGVKSKTPGTSFNIANIEAGFESGTKSHNTNSVILYGEVTSKLNINACYIDKAGMDGVFLLKSSPNASSSAKDQYKKALDANYKYDIYLNDDRGKAYDYCLNENGVESFPIFNNDQKDNIYICPNRIVRSEVISSESLTEGWRIFRPTNYSDIDYTKGEIVSIKSSDSKLYIQCKYGLKINEVKDVIANNDVNLTYLGTGDLFDRPPYELLYSPNGYIGCIDQNHTIFSLFGYIVVDIENKRIFVINDQGINCITDTYVQEWFKDNLFINDTVSIAVDEFKKIMYVTVIKNGYSNNNFDYDVNGFRNGYTIAYNFVTKSWISFYNYVPALSFFIDQLYTISNGNAAIYKQSKSHKGIFYGTRFDSKIKILFSRPNEGQRLLRSVIWDSEYIDTGVVDTNRTFDKILVHTANQCTDTLPININNIDKEWFDTSAGTNKRTFFEYNNLWDIVANRNAKILVDIKTSTVPIQSSLKLDSDWYDKSKFISPFFYVLLSYNNESQSATLTVNRIMDNSTKDFR